jgi:hypothetical protein
VKGLDILIAFVLVCTSDWEILCFFQESFASVPDVQLLRCADYFGRAFSAVTAAQFGWNKILRETPLAKTVEVVYRFLHFLWTCWFYI